MHPFPRHPTGTNAWRINLVGVFQDNTFSYDTTTPGSMESSRAAVREVFRDLRFERAVNTLKAIGWKPLPLPRYWRKRPQRV